MKYKVIDNFLEKKNCERLINDAEKFSKNDHIKVLNERMLLPSTSFGYLNLLEKSSAWDELQKKLNSEEFLKLLLENLNLKENYFKITNFFYSKNPHFLLKKFKELNSKKISMIGNLNLIFYIIFKIFRSIYRILKYKFRLTNYVELLYDYSKSPNGYKREIHRDSDSRTIVFLLYLNSLDKNASGGDLTLFKYVKSNLIPARPDPSECEIIKSIPPEPGRLVIFLNSHDSLHSVNEMKNNNDYRHFLYGSFTLLGKKNQLLRNSIGNLKTNFNIFD